METTQKQAAKDVCNRQKQNFAAQFQFAINSLVGMNRQTKSAEESASFMQKAWKIELSKGTHKPVQNGTKTFINLLLDENGNLSYQYGMKTRTNIDGKVSITTEKLGKTYTFPDKKSELFQITDYAQAVILEYAPRLVYTALYTIYSKESTPKLWNMMMECVKMHKESTKAEYESYAACTTGTDAFQTVIEHTYSMQNGRKVEILPYSELKTTAFGRDLLENSSIPDNLSVDDLVSVCSIACIELMQMRIIRKPSDFRFCGGYIYGRINAYIRSQKAQQRIASNSIEIWTENGTFDVISDEKANRMLSEVDMKETVLRIIDFVQKNCGNKAKKERIASFITMKVEGYKNAEIAEMLGISRQQAIRYDLMLEKVANIPDFKILLSDIINGK